MDVFPAMDVIPRFGIRATKSKSCWTSGEASNRTLMVTPSTVSRIYGFKILTQHEDKNMRPEYIRSFSSRFTDKPTRVLFLGYLSLSPRPV
jgi:hypothetical protein